MQTAMRLMQNKRVQQAMQSPRLQQAVSRAIERGTSIKAEIDELKRTMVERLDLATEDDLRSMKLELERLQREMAQLKTDPDVDR